MTSPAVPERSVSPGGLALANLSLGASFALYTLFSPGTKVLGYLGVTSLLKILPHYQQHLVFAMVSYWMPALLIYVLVRALRVDRRLRPNVAVHSTIALANVLTVLYAAARIFASTVEGGGASYVVSSLAPFVLVPVWVLLAIGFLTLLVKSAGFAGRAPIPPDPRPLTKAEALVVACAIAAPVAFAFTLPVGKMITLATQFDRLCKTAEIKVYETVTPQRGIAVLPDSFSYMSPVSVAEALPLAEFLLNQSLLEFIERPATKETGIVGTAKYERVSTTGERVLRSPAPIGERVFRPQPGSSARTQFVYEPTDLLISEYEVRPTRLNVAGGDELGLGGARIEIRRRNDNKLVASAQYFWNKTEFRACPKESQQGLFVYHFVADALNVRNPKGPK